MRRHPARVAFGGHWLLVSQMIVGELWRREGRWWLKVKAEWEVWGGEDEGDNPRFGETEVNSGDEVH